MLPPQPLGGGGALLPTVQKDGGVRGLSMGGVLAPGVDLRLCRLMFRVRRALVSAQLVAMT